MNASGWCYTGELAVFPDTSALPTPPHSPSEQLLHFTAEILYYILHSKTKFAALQAVRS